ncbi:cyclin-dependent kinase 2-interacting protein-like [Pararge aegeria]|uniref:Jg14863 protein n=2 Tax=Pararge aegeria TaxID=116150 RepID=A0A8S4R6S4_9NEOP|nr:cyclin-dependent kinase 2-interacting protein-like [Pararge aegeria]CAH2229404.1 jg14863 [Pararge aegeria aegeria]
MSKTPLKSAQDINFHFSPKEITSPNKDSPGISKTVYTHLTTLHRLLNDWLSVRIKGVQICKTLNALKLHECEDDYYPHQIKPLTESLLQSLDALKDIVDGAEIINSQMQALSKLQLHEEPVINTWSVSEISASISNICNTLQKELRLKQVITENIAHCRDENLIEVYASAWEFEIYFNMESNSYLFAEVGLL